MTGSMVMENRLLFYVGRLSAKGSEIHKRFCSEANAGKMTSYHLLNYFNFLGVFGQPENRDRRIR